MTIQQFKEEIFKCCGSRTWVEKLSEKYPFPSVEELKNESDKIWFSLSEKDWLEAFTQHPKIGDMKSLEKKFASTKQWAENEQSAVNIATQTVLQELKDGNDAYEKKFGYIFIICATGKSAEEMLSILKSRLKNSPQEEIKIAVHEQNKITHLRIDKLFS
ncbi:MAG TPA: 2-oxo-4-hydroxy-4-carboxy-5-ureidoimidazoline decarboxylase [Bacteroidia bacterium]|nr:2-oxo-4-hydroxy-4-carboxy-5-ureidoimidazoline decarboxylase [Bacteroidia bacterium]